MRIQGNSRGGDTQDAGGPQGGRGGRDQKGSRSFTPGTDGSGRMVASPTRAGSRLYWETVSSWWTERELHGGGETRKGGEGVLIRQTTLGGGE